MSPSYLNLPEPQAKPSKVRKWQRFLRRLAVFGYVIFIVSGLFAFWLNINLLFTFLINIKNLSGTACFVGGGLFAFRFFRLPELRRLIAKHRGTWKRYENVYIACQVLWVLAWATGVLVNPVLRQTPATVALTLAVLGLNHSIFLLYCKHIKTLEVRLAGFGAREEKLSIPDSGSPFSRESER